MSYEANVRDTVFL